MNESAAATKRTSSSAARRRLRTRRRERDVPFSLRTRKGVDSSSGRSNRPQRDGSEAQTGSEATRGGMVGVSAPPAFSTVTATTSPSATSPSTRTTSKPSLAREDPGRDRVVVLDDPGLIRLARRRRAEVREDERGAAVRRRRRGGRCRSASATVRAPGSATMADAARSRASAARVSSRSPERLDPQRPSASATTAATAATAPRTGTVRRLRDSNGTTFCGGSARTSARIRSRSAALGAGPGRRDRERLGRLPERRELLLAVLAARQVRLVGAALLGDRARRARSPRSAREFRLP